MTITTNKTKRCLIYHVIGTLTPEHIALSLWSLANQDPHVKWDELVVYNASLFSDDAISEKIVNPKIKGQFETIRFHKVKNGSKSVVADWDTICKEITGADVYLVFKADFILPLHTLATLERKALPTTDPWFINFYKLDAKEHVTDKEFKEAAKCRNVLAIANQFKTALYTTPFVKQAKFILPPVPVGALWDGIMHAYSETARPFFKVEEKDKVEWGYTAPIQRMADAGVELIQIDQLFVLHKWHEVPQKTDEFKLVKGERF